MAKIFWLASYPKSGNTWLRIFLTNYWRNAAQPARINELEKTPIASSRLIFEHMAGVEAAELTEEEIERTRPAVYRAWAASRPDPIFAKAHDACLEVASGQPLFPTEVTAGAVYLVRNPLDVALSLAAHSGMSVDRVIMVLGDANYALSDLNAGIGEQLRQKLGTWHGHVESWLAAAQRFPVLLMRYEDLHTSPITAYGEVVRFLGLDEDPERLRRAIEFSCFAQIQTQERLYGFAERPAAAQQFFNHGVPGRWRSELSPAQVERIVAQHCRVMDQLGYLPERGGVYGW